MDLSYKKAKLHTEISVASIGLIVSISGMNTGRMVYNKIIIELLECGCADSVSACLACRYETLRANLLTAACRPASSAAQ